ncbi:MAG TPA: iron ABC transporter permease, partial [Stackebrandtia sp.]|uniref:FecCD family ABC transporter permease n=1 Tax=Stackebrandtia sp. TaxID=2023065 RepID=UPI002D423385
MLDAVPSAAARRRPLRLGAVLAAGLVGLGLCVVLSLAVGTRPVAPGTVVSALFGEAHGKDAIAVTGIRLPRTLVGIAVGAALGVAGALCQGLTRNPLASPTTLGVNAGASLAVVVAIFGFGLRRPAEFLPFALLGACVAAAAVFGLARGARDLNPVRLALTGTVLAVVLGSWTSMLMLLSQRTLDEARFWLVGSLAGRDLGMLGWVAVPLGVGLVAALGSAPALNALSLGDASAASLGVRVARVRVVGGAAAVLLAGSAVAV